MPKRIGGRHSEVSEETRDEPVNESDWHKRPATDELEAFAKSLGLTIEVVCRALPASGCVKRFEYWRVDDWGIGKLFHKLGNSVAEAKRTIEQASELQ